MVTAPLAKDETVQKMIRVQAQRIHRGLRVLSIQVRNERATGKGAYKPHVCGLDKGALIVSLVRSVCMLWVKGGTNWPDCLTWGMAICMPSHCLPGSMLIIVLKLMEQVDKRLCWSGLYRGKLPALSRRVYRNQSGNHEPLRARLHAHKALYMHAHDFCHLRVPCVSVTTDGSNNEHACVCCNCNCCQQ